MKVVIKCVTPVVLGAMILAGCGQPNTETASAPPPEAAAPAATAPAATSPAETTPAKAPPVTVSGAKAKAVKVGDMAVCAVCNVKESGAKPEEVKAVLAYKGKTYAFCELAEKAEFISSPAKYAK